MIVDPRYGTKDLIETYVIESFETGTRNLAHAIIGYQELLLPAHEYVLPVTAILVVEVRRLFGLLSHCTPRWKARPRLHIIFVCGSPILVAGLKSEFRADDLSLKAGGQRRVLGCEA